VPKQSLQEIEAGYSGMVRIRGGQGGVSFQSVRVIERDML